MRLGDHLRFYHGPGNVAAVEVFVRLPEGNGPARLPASTRLSLKGPYCDLAQMLAAGFTFERAGPGLWQTTVVDPVYWTPLMPAYYRLQVEGKTGRAGGEFVEVGLRRLQVQGKHLVLDGRRWVFRGTSAARVAAGDMAAFQELLLGLIIGQFEPALLQAASRRGVPLMVKLDGPNWAESLRRAVRWPAVQLALLPGASNVTRGQLADVAPNIVHVAQMAESDVEEIPDWADAVLWPADATRGLTLPASTTSRPVLVSRAGALQWSGTPAEAIGIRRACEQLQEDLGTAIDASGYVV